MSNKNYVAGRKFEWKIRDVYKTLGFDVYRTAGSHSPVDLIAVNENGVLFIQCKKGRLKKSELSDFFKLAKKYPRNENYDFRVANLVKRKGKKKADIVIYWVTPAGCLVETEN